MKTTMLRIRLLGGFQLWVDDRGVPDGAWRQRRAATLVAMLALAPGHRLTREQVIDTLWPDLPPEAGAANLRKAAHRARRAMEVDDGIVLRAGSVELGPEASVVTDVADFEAASDAALQARGVDACRAAAARYTGELLPDDRYAPWCAAERDRLRSRYLETLSAGQLWGRVLELDPAHEEAHREIIRGQLEAGDRRAAIRQFERMRTALRDELGVSPDDESLTLYQQVLDLDVPADVPTPAERARAVLAWGVVHWERADLVEAGRAAAEARALAIDAGLGRELADASELLGLVAYAQGRWREVFAREFVEAVKGGADLAPFVFDANMCMSEFALHEADGLHTMAGLAEEILTASAEVGSAQLRALGLLLRGEATLLGGHELPEARADLAEAARLHAEASSTTGSAIATERLAQTEALLGRRQEAQRLHREARALAADSAVPNHLLLFVYGGALETTDENVIDLIGAAMQAVTRSAQPPCDPCSMPFHVGAVSALTRAGELARAREHQAEAERIAARWRRGPWEAAVTETRAALQLAEGADIAEVVALLEGAAAGFIATARPREAARCHATLRAIR